eukprot:8450181-Alexandrium_andersonii.AAC.1
MERQEARACASRGAQPGPERVGGPAWARTRPRQQRALRSEHTVAARSGASSRGPDAELPGHRSLIRGR